MIFRRNMPLSSVVFILLICRTLSSPIYAQESLEQTRKSFFWINGGPGLSLNGVAAGLGLSIQPARPGYLLFSLRGSIAAEILGDDINDVAVLVGYSSKKPQSHGYFSIATGVSYVGGTAVEATFGIPAEVQLFYTPLSFMGVGLQVFANFNKEKTFGGVLLCLQFGKLR